VNIFKASILYISALSSPILFRGPDYCQLNRSSFTFVAGIPVFFIQALLVFAAGIRIDIAVVIVFDREQLIRQIGQRAALTFRVRHHSRRQGGAPKIC
jgi:hypothetical protein